MPVNNPEYALAMFFPAHHTCHAMICFDQCCVFLVHSTLISVQAPQDKWQQDGFTTRIAAVACRYPQPAGSADGCSGVPGGTTGFWGALQGGANLQSVVPASRWDVDAVYMPDTAAKYAVVPVWEQYPCCHIKHVMAISPLACMAVCRSHLSGASPNTISWVMALSPLCRKIYVRFGAFVDGVDQFDSGAFRLPYAEAAALDPQARILLEQTHVSVQSFVG